MKVSSMKKELIIFDMDGVIIDSERVSDQIWQAILKDYGLHLSDQDRLSLIGTDGVAIRKFFLEKFKVDHFDELSAEWFKRYQAYDDTIGIPIKAGVMDYLKHLKASGPKIAVATSSPTFLAEKLLKKIQVYDLMDYHVYGDMVSKRKPDPMIYHKVMDYFKVDKEKVLIFEDSFSGVKAANHAQVDVVLVDDLADVRYRDGIHFVDFIYSFNDDHEKCNAIIFK